MKLAHVGGLHVRQEIYRECVVRNTEDEIFLITEAWMKPGAFERFKTYRVQVLKILEPYSPEFVFYSHPFAWAFESGDGDFPTGMEVCRFKNETIARAAISAIENSGIRNSEKEVFSKIRSYLSRYAFK